MKELFYYIDADCQQIGPVGIEKLRQKILDGSLSGDTLVWTEGLATWTPLSSVITMLPESAKTASRRLVHQRCNHTNKLKSVIHHYLHFLKRLRHPYLLIGCIILFFSSTTMLIVTLQPDGISPIAFSQKEKVKKELMNLGIPPVDYEKRLIEFAQKGNDEYVNLIIIAGGRVNTTEQCRRGRESVLATPLSEAAYNGHVKCVRILLDTPNIDVNLTQPLVAAAQQGHLDCLKLILHKKGIRVNERCSSGATALISAIRNGHSKCAELLLRGNGIAPNLSDGYGCTALYYAVSQQSADIVSLLLNIKGIDINSRNSSSAYTPLMAAVKNDDLQMLKLLLEQEGIDVNAEDSLGWTALKIALRERKGFVAKALINEPRTDLDKVKASDAPNDYLRLAYFMERSKRIGQDSKSDN